MFLQPVAESKAWCLLLLLTIVWKQRGRVHTCSHGIKRLTGGLFLTLMFIPSTASSPQATENTVDYLIVLYTDGRLQFHCHFMIQSWESYLSAEKMGNAWERGIIHRRIVCFASPCYFLIPFWGVHKSQGKTTSLCTWNLRLQINWSELGRRLFWFTA